MKKRWLIPVVVFAILVVCYILRGFFQTRITVEMLQTDKIEESSAGLGVLIKSESVNTVSIGGVTEVYVGNGQRVADKEIIATVYSGTTDEASIAQLADINKKINAIIDSHSGEGVFINDATKIESEIADIVDEVILKATEYDLEAISEYKYKISTLADQKAVAKGEKETFSNDLAKLRGEKSVLEEKLGTIQTVVKAENPGIYIEGSDGFEEELTPDSIETLTPKTINEIISRDKNGEVVKYEEGTYSYKIIDNYSYFVAINIDEKLGEEINVGDNVSVRFSDFTSNDCPAVVRYISEPNDKKIRTVVAECSNYVDGLLSKRVVNVEFIKKSVSGYKVKVEYLHTVDNAIGIFVKRGAVMKFIPVNIVYSTEDEAIVSASADDKPIKSYDEVVTSAPEYYDGRIIVS